MHNCLLNATRADDTKVSMARLDLPVGDHGRLNARGDALGARRSRRRASPIRAPFLRTALLRAPLHASLLRAAPRVKSSAAASPTSLGPQTTGAS